MKNLFCKIFKDTKKYEEATEITNTESEKHEEATEITNTDNPTDSEEWVWVEGYKGTNSDMICMGYQYELGKRYDMPEDEAIVECSNGFHLCLTLGDVFEYYSRCENNRFFKVKALVRKNDVVEYGKYIYRFYRDIKKDKLVSKSIEFISECTVDEILSDYNTDKWSDEDKRKALLIGPDQVETNIIYKTRVEELVNYGYSIPFSRSVAKDDDKYSKACTVASQPGVSMDVKVLTIFLQ